MNYFSVAVRKHHAQKLILSYGSRGKVYNVEEVWQQAAGKEADRV